MFRSLCATFKVRDLHYSWSSRAFTSAVLQGAGVCRGQRSLFGGLIHASAWLGDDPSVHCERRRVYRQPGSPPKASGRRVKLRLDRRRTFHFEAASDCACSIKDVGKLP